MDTLVQYSVLSFFLRLHHHRRHRVHCVSTALDIIDFAQEVRAAPPPPLPPLRIAKRKSELQMIIRYPFLATRRWHNSTVVRAATVTGGGSRDIWLMKPQIESSVAVHAPRNTCTRIFRVCEQPTSLFLFFFARAISRDLTWFLWWPAHVSHGFIALVSSWNGFPRWIRFTHCPSRFFRPVFKSYCSGFLESFNRNHVWCFSVVWIHQIWIRHDILIGFDWFIQLTISSNTFNKRSHVIIRILWNVLIVRVHFCEYWIHKRWIIHSFHEWY